MNTIDQIRFAMGMTDGLTARMLDDLPRSAVMDPLPGGSHATWEIGHLAFIEGCLPFVLTGEPNPVAHWEGLFAMGTKPMTDSAAYPPFEEILKTYRDLRAKNLKLLETLGESSLNRKPANVPPGFEKSMQTFGQTYLLIALHNMQHCGKISVTRRAAGIPPMM